MGNIGPAALPDPLRKEILAAVVDAETVGVLLGGSFARGEATPWSDVDVWVVRSAAEPRTGKNQYRRASTEDRLIAWSTTTVAREVERMAAPKTAIWVVQGIRQAVVLLDRDGSIGELKRLADAFRWESLAATARAEAVANLAGLCEEVEKVLTGLVARDPYRIGNALPALETGLATAVALSRGILIETENRWLRQVENAVGEDSPWSRAHRQMLGIDGERSSTIWERAEAGLRCYLETAALFAGLLESEELRVVDLARRQIESRTHGR